MRSSELLSDAALHLFLQSDLSVEEMEEKLKENAKPVLKKSESRLTPYLLRSLSSGSSGSAGSESEFNGERSDGENSENEDGSVEKLRSKISIKDEGTM